MLAFTTTVLFRVIGINLLTEGGSGVNDNGDSYNITGIGIESSEAIAFRNLTVYLTPGSDYEDARFYAIESAIDLFGVCTEEVEQTANAWYAVGVGEIYNPETIAAFSTPDAAGCTVPHMVNFTNLSTNATSYEWDFGDGTTSTDVNPSHLYTEAGTYTVTLFADGGDCGSDELIEVDFIVVDPSADCIVIMPETGSVSTQFACEGTIFDSGGDGGNYGANEDATVTISPFGALTVDLTFPFFDVEAGPGTSCDFDYLEVYDGDSEFSPLIGRYCNNEIPTAISSTGPSITVLFHSDGEVQDPGFEINWSCNLPEEAPEAAYVVNSEVSCTGEVFFIDQSTNAPTEWLWEFGDGETSTEQHPSHIYDSEGTYTVSLTATNLIGDDIHTEIDYINVSYPLAPMVEGDTACIGESATLTATGDGTLRWYDTPTGGTPITEGGTFVTPDLDDDMTYYVEDDQFDSPVYVGPEDNDFAGGGFFVGDQHLVFNNSFPVIL